MNDHQAKFPGNNRASPDHIDSIRVAPSLCDGFVAAPDEIFAWRGVGVMLPRHGGSFIFERGGDDPAMFDIR
jgi:hypothetical protein